MQEYYPGYEVISTETYILYKPGLLSHKTRILSDTSGTYKGKTGKETTMDDDLKRSVDRFWHLHYLLWRNMLNTEEAQEMARHFLAAYVTGETKEKLEKLTKAE